jgi:hypothetical protein
VECVNVIGSSEWQPRSLDIDGRAEATHLRGMELQSLKATLAPCRGGVCGGHRNLSRWIDLQIMRDLGGDTAFSRNGAAY